MIKTLAQLLIRLYQILLSPIMGNQCRYHPTCSSYAHEAYDKFGFLKGSILSIFRVCSCHPYSKRPWTDPVPERFAILDIIRYKQGNPKQNNQTK